MEPSLSTVKFRGVPLAALSAAAGATPAVPPITKYEVGQAMYSGKCKGNIKFIKKCID